jgi:hydrogenase-4 component F
VQAIAFGEPDGPGRPVKGSLMPMYLHLALVLAAGLYLPAPLVEWFQTVARQLG